jgi:hypothetical protein
MHVPRCHRSPRRIASPSVTAAFVCLLLAGFASERVAAQQEATPSATAEQRDWFESKIRPVLVEHCYECHNSHEKSESGLAVDARDAMRRGGDGGAGVVPGDPQASRLLLAMRHELEGIEMPEGRPILPARVLADFETWIRQGAYDPRDTPPTREEIAAATSWETVRAKRMKWWSFQPITQPVVPDAPGDKSSSHSIDRFIRARLAQEKIEASPPADRRALLRRVCLVLTGLPPSEKLTREFLADTRPDAYENLVDRLLRSPEFGECWARHWMDWVRYAETHGSEGDPAIPFAWQYRDYLVRAWNNDIPYDQLVREHLAGDLLEQPRINAELQLNESRLGTAHFRFVQHGFSPTDALDELVRFTDNQIDVVSKAFLGVTLSCARCHDHKFDPISQRDYYALYGVLASCRPATVTVDTGTNAAAADKDLAQQKSRIKAELATLWASRTSHVAERLLAPDEAARERIAAAAPPTHPLSVWRELHTLSGDEFASAWQDRVRAFEESRGRLDSREHAWRQTDARRLDPRRTPWFTQQPIDTAQASPAGEFIPLLEGDRVLDRLQPAGFYSHALSSKQAMIWSSPRFQLDMKQVFVRAMGVGGARARYVVQHYPRTGTVYPMATLQDAAPRWVSWDVEYWRGDLAHLELTTAADQAVEGSFDVQRSGIGFSEVLLLTDEQVRAGLVPQEEMAEFLAPLFDAELPPTTDAAGLARRYEQALAKAIDAWQEGTASDAQARFLSAFLTDEWLPTRVDASPALAAAVSEYREREAERPAPIRAPGVLEADVRDAPLLQRGNHKQPLDPVPRGFLEALTTVHAESAASSAAASGGSAVIAQAEYPSRESGRRQWAEAILDEHNPLTRRVIVNRLWHHVFGRGLVETPDNFGHLGAQPTHPELLDWLANQLPNENWSLKRMIRLMVLSDTFRASSTATPSALALDPANRWCARAPLRRLPAEALRDALLATSGQLDPARSGPPVDDNQPRRSIYLRVRRNAMNPLLSVFDAPTPFTTQGRRDVTNVPAQSLTLMNDPAVTQLAAAWIADDFKTYPADPPTARVRRMFELAMARPPRDDERQRLLQYLDTSGERHREEVQAIAASERAWNEATQQRTMLLETVRTRLREQSANQPFDPLTFEPLASWNFTSGQDLRDQRGGLALTMHGGARWIAGGVELDGSGHLVSDPIPQELRAKTLEAWVRLDNLTQRGGGVLSLQTLDGTVFDAIVFAELSPGQWVPGSNVLARTQALGGAEEKSAATEPVHLAITYAEDGQIRAFRDGEPYGQAYKSSGPVVYAASRSVVTLGLRHLPAIEGRFLKGTVLGARLYSRALPPEEIRALATQDPTVVPLSRVLAHLTEQEQSRFDLLQRDIERLEVERAQWSDEDRTTDPHRAWRDLALAIFNLKEFLYVR